MKRRGPFVWSELHLPAPMTAGAAQHALLALSALSGQPRLVLEARGSEGRVRWFLGAEAGVARRAVAAMSPHLTGLRSSADTTAREASSAGGALRFPGHRRTALDTTQTEAVARGVLGALAGASGKERVQLQVVLGPRHRPRPVGRVPSELRTTLRAKYGEHRFSCEIRISAKAETIERSRRLIENVAANVRALEAPGVALRLRKASTHSVDAVTDPFLWPLELGVSEIGAMLGWPIAARDAELPGVAAPHPRLLPVSTQVPRRGRVLGSSASDEHRPVAIAVEDPLRHLHILGPNGVGKSVLLANLALQDAEAGRGFVVVDPKGDLVTDLLQRLPEGRHADVVVLDPTDVAPVGVAAFRGDAERAADVIFGVFKSLYGGDLGPRSSDVLHAGLLTLARAGDCSLAQMPMLLGNPGFRRTVVTKVATRDPMGLGSFWAWFEALSDAERVQVVAPLRNKLDPVLSLRPGLRAVFGQCEPRFSFDDVFAGKKILLVSLASGVLGPEGARLLGSLVIALLWQAAGARVRLPTHERRPVSIYVDEMQEVVRLSDLGDALAMARGYGVSFVLSHQSLSQLSPAMREAVMANARSRVCFQLGPRDARDVAVTTNGLLAAQDFQELPAFRAYASILSHGNRAPWCSIATRPLPPAIADARRLRARSRAEYGRPTGDVEAELLATAGLSPGSDESFGRSARRNGGAPS